MTPLQIVLLRAPCYQDSAQVRGAITMAETMVNATAFGALRSTAVALLSLHTLALGARGATAAAGAITSESEGDLSRSYATPPSGAGNDWYSLTAWGLEYLALQKQTNGPAFLNRRFGEIG